MKANYLDFIIMHCMHVQNYTISHKYVHMLITLRFKAEEAMLDKNLSMGLH